MINDRFIILLEKYFENSLTAREQSEFDDFLKIDKYFEEFQKQKSLKEVFMKMNLKEPKNNFWDDYWLNIYNRLERGIAWILISLGLTFLIGYAIYEFIQKLFVDDGGPVIVKLGLITLFIGALILILSLIREQFIKFKNDNYKEIKR